MTLIHATCVAVSGTGVLLRGPPGSGKSDLALRLIDRGAVLVADDQVSLAVSDGRLVATAPAAIAGRLEIRGIGVVPVDSLASALVGLAVDLVAPAAVARMPDPARCAYLGVGLRLIALAPFEASAPAKVRLAVRAATG